MKSIYFFLLCFWALVLPAQKIPKDVVATQKLIDGRNMMEAKDYADAARAFDEAATRPFNQTTSSATFMAGVAYYHDGQTAMAGRRFSTLLKDYPESRYLPDAKYYLALMDLEHGSDAAQMAAVKKLLDLKKTQNVDLGFAKACQDAVSYFLHNQANGEVISALYENHTDTIRTLVVEAWAYRFFAEGQKKEARMVIDAFQQDGGLATPFMTQMMAKKQEEIKPTKLEADRHPEVVSIAMILPFFVDPYVIDSLRQIPAKHLPAIEFYEGFHAAIKDNAGNLKKRYYLRVMDSQRENSVVEEQLQQLNGMNPDLVIGDIFNKQTRLISDWCEQNERVQFVPLSPSGSLIEGKKYTFLARPSSYTHGVKMAEYAFKELNMRKATVVTDQKGSGGEMANGFLAQFKAMGGNVQSILLDSVQATAMTQIPAAMRGLSTDGIFAPLSNAELLGMVFSYFTTAHGYMMASPDVELMSTIKQDVKERVSLLYPSSYYTDKNNAEYQDFYNSYLQEHKTLPSETYTQGYDLAKLVMTLGEEHKPEYGSMADFLKRLPIQFALHLDYNFQGKQDNQVIRILNYGAQGLQVVK